MRLSVRLTTPSILGRKTSEMTAIRIDVPDVIAACGVARMAKAAADEPQIRNSKFEIRNKFEIQKRKFQTAENVPALVLVIGILVL